MRVARRLLSILALGGLVTFTACTEEHLPIETGPDSINPPFAPAGLSHTAAYPLTVSANRRYLVDQDNVPFLIAGESPQALMVQLSPAQAETFFANRESHGFNAVWINLLCRQSFTGRTDGSTFDGIVPFTTPNDLSTPNEAYFARCDQMISLAANHHLLVILDPIETIDHLLVLTSNGPTKCRNFGRYLGNRYKNFDNIVWMSGNDYQTWPVQDNVVSAVALGIQETDTRHIHTVELDYYVSGSLDDAVNWQSIIDLNASYTYYPTYIQVLSDYNRATDLMPVFMVEATYEYEHSANAATLRRQEYWSILSGATGQLYGSGYTWGFISGWEGSLNSPGATQMAYVQNLFLSRSWYELVPDQNHTFVTAGYGTFAYNTLFDMNSNYVTAALTPDGNLGMAYLPSSRTITVNMARLSGGQAKAWWYNPVNGQATLIGTYAASGSRNFTPTAAGDWVLVLDNATLNLGPPGTAAPPSNPPSVATPASAAPNPTSGTTTGLSVLGADDGGEGALTYTWAATGTPPGPVSFSPNGTNAAKNSTATFTKAGSYALRVSIADAGGQVVTSSVNVTVNPAYSSVGVAPASASVVVQGTQQFAATARDQFGYAMPTQPSFTWSVSGGGSIGSSGLFTAGATPGGPFTVTATGGARSGSAAVTVTAAGAITIGETVLLSIDDSGNGNLLIAQATSLAQTAQIQSLSFYVATASGKLRLGIYDATGPSGGPGAKKAETAEITPVTGWNTASVTTPVSLPAGNYWLAYLPNQNGLHFRRSATGICKYYSYGYGAMPATFGTSTTTLVDHWSFYATLTPGGGNTAPTVATPAAANPNPVTGATTNLSVLGADDGGEPALIYTWSTPGTPPAPVTFSVNGTNAAKNSAATFTKAGSYNLRATIQDSAGLTATSNVTVAVDQTLTSIVVTPASASVPVGGIQQFSATARDQFGNALTTQPSFAWSVSGGGTINTTGRFTAGTVAGGPYTVTAAASGRSGTASVTVTSTNSIRIGETNVLSIDDHGNANLLIAQSATLGQTATIQGLSFYVTTAAGKLRLGIYDATGPSGGPGAKKAETAEITPITGWNTAVVTTPVSLPAGTYWLAYLPSSDSLHFRRGGSGTCRYRSYTYGVLPATFGTPTTNISDRWSFYGTLMP